MKVNRYASAAIGASLALAVAIGLGRFGFTAAFPLMLRDGVVGLRSGALAQTAHFIGYFAGAVAVFRLPAGRNALACTIGVIASVLLLAATGYADGVPSVCAARLLSGISSGVVMVTASTWLFATAGTRWAPILYGGAGIGIVAAGEGVADLSVRGASEKEAWLVLAATGVALAIPSLLVLARRPARAPTVTRAAPSIPDIGVQRLVLAYATCGFGYVVSATYLPLLVAHAAGGFDPIHVFSFFGLCAAPSCAVWLRLERAFGTRRALAAACVLQALGSLLPIISERPLAIFAAAGAVGGTFMGVVAVAMSAGRRYDVRGSLNPMAVLTAAYAIGQALGPAMCSMLVTTSDGAGRALAVAAGTFGCAAAMILMPQPMIALAVRHARVRP